MRPPKGFFLLFTTPGKFGFLKICMALASDYRQKETLLPVIYREARTSFLRSRDAAVRSCRVGKWITAIVPARLKAVLGRSQVAYPRSVATAHMGSQLPAMVTKPQGYSDSGGAQAPRGLPSLRREKL